MSSHLKNKRGVAETSASAFDLAETFETVAQRIEGRSRTVERMLTRYAEEVCARASVNRPRVSRITSHPSAVHTGAGHRHDLLCVAAADACSRIRRMAAFLRALDAQISSEGLPRPFLPNVYVRTKEARHVERMNVERSIEWLARWAYDHGIASEGTPVEGFARPYLPDQQRTSERTRKEAICRVLYELFNNGRDSDLTRAIRDLAQEQFNGAGAVEAIIQRMTACNPDITGEPTGVGMIYWTPRTNAMFLAVPNSIAFVMNEAEGVSHFLRALELTIRVKCLFSPYDHAPRGERPEQVLYLSQIKDLACSGFTENEIAELIDDGFDGDVTAREKRVRDNLDRDKLRDRRTKHIGPLMNECNSARA
jgi:hypothetical protein